MLREHWRTLAIGVVVVLFAFAAFRGGDGDGGDASSGGGTAATTPPAGGSTDEQPPEGAVDDPSATPLTTLTPPDVAHERPEVDLATPPPATDPVEVARWWAAVYAVHVGAEPPADLAARLAPLTTERYRQTLHQLPLAASYDAPLALAGATANEVASGPGTRVVRVTVETSLALVVYDVHLTEGPPGTWLVNEAVRV
ncbi:MAG TPA: hypothetical protein VIL36_17470 [Acidimicrobiales bacterium]